MIERDYELWERVDKLNSKVQNLESFMQTQTALNKKLCGLKSIDLERSEEDHLEEISFEDYSRIINEKLNKGDLQGALNFAAAITLTEEDLHPKKKAALLEIKRWFNKQKWNTQDGIYTIAYWFELQPMLPRDVDGIELRAEDTLLCELPLLTLKQAYSLIKHKREELEVYLSRY